jgi:putative PIN family toxin of toxin-antitoxin system
MTSAVLDTNVVVSAHIQPAGIPARILLLAFANEFKLYVSSGIVAEYDDVLRRPKFKLNSEVIDGFLKSLSATAVVVAPTTVIRVAKDPDATSFWNVLLRFRPTIL